MGSHQKLGITKRLDRMGVFRLPGASIHPRRDMTDYCLMDNCYHLLLENPNANSSAFISRSNGSSPNDSTNGEPRFSSLLQEATAKRSRKRLHLNGSSHPWIFLKKDCRSFKNPVSFPHRMYFPKWEDNKVIFQDLTPLWLKIPLRPQADHASAIRAPIPLQPKRLVIAVKIGRNKPVPPDPAPTTWTSLRFRPKEIPARLKKLLDSQRNKDYQRSMFGGSYPSVVSGARVPYHSCPTLSSK